MCAAAFSVQAHAAAGAASWEDKLFMAPDDFALLWGLASIKPATNTVRHVQGLYMPSRSFEVSKLATPKPVFTMPSVCWWTQVNLDATHLLPPGLRLVALVLGLVPRLCARGRGWWPVPSRC